MISQNAYKTLKRKYGIVSSWAVWSSPQQTAKSNTSDMSWLEEGGLLDVLDTGFVFIGLNVSSAYGDILSASGQFWTNFHSGYRYQNDYKLRYALMNTRYWGSYMTDVIKYFPEVDSGKVKQHIKSHPDVVGHNIETLKEELGYLQPNSVLVAMGHVVYRILLKNFGDEYRIVKIPHYSMHISKEKYREIVLSCLSIYE